MDPSNKRSIDEVEGADAPAAKRQAVEGANGGPAASGAKPVMDTAYLEQLKSSQKDPNAPSTVSIDVPNQYIGAVIGHRGENIKSVQAASGAHLQVGRKEPHRNDRSVTISGTSAQVTVAYEKVVALVQEAAQMPEGHFQEQLNSSAPASQVVNVPTRNIGSVIGHGGDNIKEIQKATGAHLKVAPRDDTKDERAVTITGTESQIEQAKAMIVAKINGEGDRQGMGMGMPPMGMGGMGMPMPAGGVGALMMPATGPTLVFAVPNAHIGSVIGHGGSNINSVQRASGAHVHVGQRSASGGDREVTVTGTTQQVETARRLILQKLAEEHPEYQMAGAAAAPAMGMMGGGVPFSPAMYGQPQQYAPAQPQWAQAQYQQPAAYQQQGGYAYQQPGGGAYGGAPPGAGGAYGGAPQGGYDQGAYGQAYGAPTDAYAGYAPQGGYQQGYQ